MREMIILLMSALVATGCTVSNSTDQKYNSSEHTESFISGDKRPHLRPSCTHTDTAFNCVKVVKVYDGDTIFIDIENIPPVFGRRIGVRIADIDTPEISSRDACEKRKAQEAKSLLESFIVHAKRVDVVNVTRDKYFRVGGVVLVDGKPVSEELLKRNLAYPYHGEKKQVRDWCY